MLQNWTSKQQNLFISHLRESGNVSASIRHAGVDRRSAYARRKTNPEFRAKWQDALSEATDVLEGELRSRALLGTSKPVFYGGKECGSVQNYNETLGMFLLKGRRPEIFGNSNADEAVHKKPENKRGKASEELMAKLETMAIALEQNKLAALENARG